MTTMNTDERLKQIRERHERFRRSNKAWGVNSGVYDADVDFLLSLLDRQATTKPVGWISCGLRHGHDRIVDIVFENADCAKAFIEGVNPAVGPIVAAARMRDKCVDAIKSLRAVPHGAAYGNAIIDAINKIESLTLDSVTDQKGEQDG